MEQKFPLESDFGKYFLYNLYLRATANNGSKEKKLLESSNKFNKCLNLNRYALRGYNCGEKKKVLDNYFNNNSDQFTEFKEKVSNSSCNNQLSSYLTNYFYSQSSYVNSSLYERLSSETLLDSYLVNVKECLGLDENFILSP